MRQWLIENMHGGRELAGLACFLAPMLTVFLLLAPTFGPAWPRGRWGRRLERQWELEGRPRDPFAYAAMSAVAAAVLGCELYGHGASGVAVLLALALAGFLFAAYDGRLCRRRIARLESSRPEEAPCETNSPTT